jgi:hypothetical protein
MIALTHLVLALLLIKFFGLDRNAAFATLLFGVFIDLDHLFGVFDFLMRDGWANALNINAAMASNIQWKSLLHSPEGILFVAPVVLMSRWTIPLVAWGLHLLMDYVQINYLGIFSPFEMVLLAALSIGLLHLERQDYLAETGNASYRRFLDWEVAKLVTFASGLPVISQIRRWRGPQGTSS